MSAGKISDGRAAKTPNIRVLVVDDSAFVRKTLRQLLEQSPTIEVVGTARDGLEALEKVSELSPDVITLDLIMPQLDGVGFLRKLMAWRPTPTIVVSIASEDGEQALAALDAGAVDIVQKPTGLASDRLREIGASLVAKVRAAKESRIVTPDGVSRTVEDPAPLRGEFEALLIGCSTGGPQALRDLIPRLPANLPVAVGVVLHMPLGFTRLYAERLDALSHLEVREAAEGDVAQPGRVLLAPSGQHLTFVRRPGGIVVAHLDAKPLDTLHRPSVDVLFRSAARVYGAKALGVVLTGMGSDGTGGAGDIRAAGGQIIAEAEQSCVVYGMPRSVVEAGLASRIVPLSQMSRAILESVATEVAGDR